jgi:NitT/TauT family transport system substrate-binding protein
MKKLKPGFKIFLIVLVVGALGFLAKTFLLPSSSSDGEVAKKPTLSLKKTPTVTIGVNTYGGFTPIVWLNNGLKANDESIIAQKYGVKLNIVIQDDFVAGRNAFRKGDIDMIYCTADSWVVECGEGSDMTDARHFMLLNWSRGSDAIVVNKNIRTVADLKGKKIAVAPMTASHTLLINTLETNGIQPTEVQIVEVSDGGAAASAFKALQVDACVTWSPDDADCVDAVSGAKVLISTKQATNIICDGLVAKATYLDENQELVSKVVSAILYANSVMNNDQTKVREAAEIFGKSFGTDAEFAVMGCSNIRFATLGDNENFYGLNANYTGVDGNELYSKMARVYSGLNLVKTPLSWRKVSNSAVIESLISNGQVDGEQSAETSRTFTPVTKEISAAPEISNKKVTINFANNSAVLDMDARNVIDREFVGIAKQFSGSRIRVVAHCDNVGSSEVNLALSQRRAQAVVEYLTKEYGFDANRFIVVGMGQQEAVRNGSKGSDQAYRRTDFQLVNE